MGACHRSHWSFQVCDLRGMIAAPWLNFLVLLCIKRKATAVALILFFSRMGHESKQKLLCCTQRDLLFAA